MTTPSLDADTMPRSIGGVLIVMLLAFAFSGCASLATIPENWFDDNAEFVTPSKIIPVWSDTVLHQAARPGQRGCGGRVMFYSGDGKRSVRVDGSLAVYVWDDSTEREDRKPVRKYVFRADDLQDHYSTSTIGDSYSFWLPWDETGGEQKELTLIARFIGRNGAEITSTPSLVILPGVLPLPPKAVDVATPDSSLDLKNAGSIQQVVFETTEESDDQDDAREQPARKPLMTSDIPLTSGFLQRNMRPDSGRTFTSQQLFGQPAVSDEGKQNGNPPAERQPTSAGHSVWDSQADTLDDARREAPRVQTITAPPVDHSLRFRHRVRTSRESRRSAGRALSERYQSNPRRAPWEKG
jgi:hypothetical protein